MSIQAMSWALEQQVVVDPPARHVLLCLANYANADGTGAFPSVATLTRDTGLSERTVRAKLAVLQDAGLISPGNARLAAVYIDRGDRRPVVYDLQLAHPARGAADAPRSTTGCSSRTNGVQLVHERGAGAAPNPSFTLQKNREAEPSALAPSSADADSPPAVINGVPITLELLGNALYQVSMKEIEAMSRAFPAVDVRAELARAALWLNANPANRKTPKGIKRFMASWLGRAQDRAPRVPAAAPNPIDGPASSRGRALLALEELRHGGR